MPARLKPFSMIDQLVATPWGKVPRKPVWFVVVSLLVFPAAILAAASFQPTSFRDKESVMRIYSINVLWLHLLTFLVVSVGFLRYFGRMRFQDLGWSFAKTPGAIAATISCWLIAQVLLLLLLACGMASGSPETASPGTIAQFMRFVANSLGTGSNEETFFRGFLLVQCYCWFPGVVRGDKLDLRAFVFAAMVSSALFAVLHFRTNITDILQLMVGGIVGACLYARTRNLLVNVGLHGLFNAPMSLASTDETISRVAVLAGISLVAVTWPFAPPFGRVRGRRSAE
jgi:membrane protease YdiL (CAAX protease family)